jgi:hypothetical protein
MQTRAKMLLWLGATGLLLLGVLAGLLLATIMHNPAQPQPTAAVKSIPKTIVIAGDIACAPGLPTTDFACRASDTAKLVTVLKPDAVLTAGDNQYPNGALSDLQANYDKTWGVFKDKTYPTPGNHDYGTTNASGYFDYFGSRAGEKGKGYYTYKIGDWQLFALNSEIDISKGSPQLIWLEQALDANKSTCSLAYWHKPRFSSGWHPSDSAYDAVWRLLYDHRVDVVVNGHSHAYERFLPQNPDGVYDHANGITQFVSGMGGKDSEKLDAPLPNLATRQNHAFGVLKLTLYPKYATYEFVPIPGQQTFVDSGVVSCH